LKSERRCWVQGGVLAKTNVSPARRRRRTNRLRKKENVAVGVFVGHAKKEKKKGSLKGNVMSIFESKGVECQGLVEGENK